MGLVFLFCMAGATVFLFVMSYLAYRDAREASAKGKELVAGMHYISTSILVSVGCVVLTLAITYAGQERRADAEHRARCALLQERQK